MKKQKDLKTQLTDIKGKITKIISCEPLLFDYENEVLNDLYNLINSILLEEVNDKYYSMEEIVDMRIMEYRIILEASENLEIKKLVKLLKKGLNW